MTQALNDKNLWVREKVAEVLGNIGFVTDNDTTVVVEALVKALDDEKEVCSSAAWALGKIGKTAKNAIPALERALSHNNYSVRRNAAWALGEIGEPAEGNASALTQVLRDQNYSVYKDATSDVGKAVEPTLARAFDDEIVLYTVSDRGDLIQLYVTAESFRSVIVDSLGEPFRNPSAVTEGLAMSSDGYLYASVNFKDSESVLYRINVQTAHVDLVGSMAQKQVDGLCFAKDDSLYGVTSIIGGGYASQLIKVDIGTGITIPVNIRLRLGDLDAIAIDSDGRVIVTDGVGKNDHFHQIDLSGNLRHRPIGPTPGGRDVEGLTFGSNGFMYGTTSDHLIRVDPETWHCTNLGDLGFRTSNLASADQK
ncbi:HEAT repeat domain-containing protein [Candidatus Poribacteria bacterium]